MIEPVLHRLVVKQFDVTEQDNAFRTAKASGIILSGTQMDREQAAVDRGTVVALGPTVFQDFKADLNLQIGDDIVFARHAGKTVRDPDQTDKDQTKYIVINDEDVIAILRKKAENA
jgi:co-chaperonin GroES (HSP10)